MCAVHRNQLWKSNTHTHNYNWSIITSEQLIIYLTHKCCKNKMMVETQNKWKSPREYFPRKQQHFGWHNCVKKQLSTCDKRKKISEWKKWLGMTDGYVVFSWRKEKLIPLLYLDIESIIMN